MKSLLFFLILACCCHSLFAQHTMKITNSCTSHIAFVKYDEFGNYHHYPIAPGITIKVDFAQPYLNLLALEDDRNVPYFFFPNDDVTVASVADRFYSFESSNKERQNELKLSTRMFQLFLDRWPMDHTVADVVSTGRQSIDSLLLTQPKSLSSSFRNLVQQYYLYDILGRKLKYDGSKSVSAEIDKYWQKSFNQTLQSYILTFRSYTLSYLPKFIQKDSLLQHYVQLFSGYHREVALYTVMHMSYYRDKDWFRSQFAQYASLSENSYFLERLSYFKLTDEVLKKANAVILVNANSDTISLEKLLTKLKGKVVLIDLWASWCVPCLEQMPYSDKLAKAYRDRHFEVLYLSMDRELPLFAASSAKLLPGKLAYNVLGNFNSPFAIQNKIKAIPRYMVVDKQGIIVNAIAPHPDDTSLKTLIEKLL